jgi:outer membrane protein OmpA-like peptidoglycan-associated protein
MGLEAERIRTENFDYQRPVATNATEEGRFKNQRSEVKEDPKAQ